MNNETKTEISVHLLPYTDLGNALRYVRLFDGRYKYIVEAKEWYFWNGKRWENDSTSSIIRNFQRVLDDIEDDSVLLEEAFQNGQLTDKQYSKLLRAKEGWHKVSQSSGKIHSAVDLARSQYRSQ